MQAKRQLEAHAWADYTILICWFFIHACEGFSCLSAALELNLIEEENAAELFDS